MDGGESATVLEDGTTYSKADINGSLRLLHASRAADDHEVLRGLFTEAALGARLEHPNISLLVDVYPANTISPDTPACLAYEDCACTLRAMQQRCGPSGIPMSDVQRITLQLVTALAYLHDRQVAHRHVRPECILLREDGILKLGGLNSAVLMPKGIKSVGRATLPITPRMTSIYSAPEVLLEDNTGFASDIWAIGCICGELLTGKSLFSGTTIADQLWRIFKDVGVCSRHQTMLQGRTDCEDILANIKQCNSANLKRRFYNLDNCALVFLERCLQEDPNNRASSRELLCCAFLQSTPPVLEAAVSEEAARVRLIRKDKACKQQLANSVSALASSLAAGGCDVIAAAAALGITSGSGFIKVPKTLGRSESGLGGVQGGVQGAALTPQSQGNPRQEPNPAAAAALPQAAATAPEALLQVQIPVPSQFERPGHSAQDSAKSSGSFQSWLPEEQRTSPFIKSSKKAFLAQEGDAAAEAPPASAAVSHPKTPRIFTVKSGMSSLFKVEEVDEEGEEEGEGKEEEAERQEKQREEKERDGSRSKSCERQRGTREGQQQEVRRSQEIKPQLLPRLSDLPPPTAQGGADDQEARSVYSSSALLQQQPRLQSAHSSRTLDVFAIHALERLHKDGADGGRAAREPSLACSMSEAQLSPGRGEDRGHDPETQLEIQKSVTRVSSWLDAVPVPKTVARGSDDGGGGAGAGAGTRTLMRANTGSRRLTSVQSMQPSRLNPSRTASLPLFGEVEEEEEEEEGREAEPRAPVVRAAPRTPARRASHDGSSSPVRGGSPGDAGSEASSLERPDSGGIAQLSLGSAARPSSGWQQQKTARLALEREWEKQKALPLGDEEQPSVARKLFSVQSSKYHGPSASAAAVSAARPPARAYDGGPTELPQAKAEVPGAKAGTQAKPNQHPRTEPPPGAAAEQQPKAPASLLSTALPLQGNLWTASGAPKAAAPVPSYTTRASFRDRAASATPAQAPPGLPAPPQPPPGPAAPVQAPLPPAQADARAQAAAGSSPEPAAGAAAAARSSTHRASHDGTMRSEGGDRAREDGEAAPPQVFYFVEAAPPKAWEALSRQQSSGGSRSSRLLQQVRSARFGAADGAPDDSPTAPPALAARTPLRATRATHDGSMDRPEPPAHQPPTDSPPVPASGILHWLARYSGSGRDLGSTFHSRASSTNDRALLERFDSPASTTRPPPSGPAEQQEQLGGEAASPSGILQWLTKLRAEAPPPGGAMDSFHSRRDSDDGFPPLTPDQGLAKRPLRTSCDDGGGRTSYASPASNGSGPAAMHRSKSLQPEGTPPPAPSPRDANQRSQAWTAPSPALLSEDNQVSVQSRFSSELGAAARGSEPGHEGSRAPLTTPLLLAAHLQPVARHTAVLGSRPAQLQAPAAPAAAEGKSALRLFQDIVAAVKAKHNTAADVAIPASRTRASDTGCSLLQHRTGPRLALSVVNSESAFGAAERPGEPGASGKGGHELRVRPSLSFPGAAAAVTPDWDEQQQQQQQLHRPIFRQLRVSTSPTGFSLSPRPPAHPSPGHGPNSGEASPQDPSTIKYPPRLST